MTTPVLFLIACCVGFTAVIALIARRFRALRSEQLKGKLPRNRADKPRVRNGDAFTHNRASAQDRS